MAIFNENGLVVDTLPEIRQKLISKAQEKFSDLLNGQTLSTDDSGVIGRILGIMSESISDQEDLVQAMNSSLDPNQASGLALDNLVFLNGLYRLPAINSTAFLLLLGDIGTVVSNASVKSQTTGDVFDITDTITFTTTNVNGVEIEVDFDGTSKEYKLEYSIDGMFSENAPVSVYSILSDTKEVLVQRISQTINAQSSFITSTVNDDLSISVYIINRTKNGDFTFTNGNIVRSFVSTEATARVSTGVVQETNTVTSINSGSQIGWRGVSNPYIVPVSLPVETDEELRKRWMRTKGFESYGNFESMYTGLISVRDVSFINIQQNITSVTNSGRTNNGISVVVSGGDGQAIAEAIFKNLPIGTVTDGAEIYYVSDINGGQHEVRFSRPSFVPIKISMSLKALPNFPTSGKNQIKQAIVDYFNSLDVGEDIYYSRLFMPINSINGFTVKNMKVAKRDGGVLGTDDITIKYNELATISANDILIGE